MLHCCGRNFTSSTSMGSVGDDTPIAAISCWPRSRIHTNFIHALIENLRVVGSDGGGDSVTSGVEVAGEELDEVATGSVVGEVGVSGDFVPSPSRGIGGLLDGGLAGGGVPFFRAFWCEGAVGVAAAIASGFGKSLPGFVGWCIWGLR